MSTQTADAALDRMQDLHRQIEQADDATDTTELAHQFSQAERAFHAANTAMPGVVAGASAFSGGRPAVASGFSGGGPAVAPGGLLARAFTAAGLRASDSPTGGRFAITEAPPGGFGDALTPTEFYSSFWDLLAPQAVGLRAGFTIVDTQYADLKLPALTADPQAAWTAEATEIAPTDPLGGYITATPRKLAGLVLTSNEVVADSSPSVLSVVEYQLTRALALKLDLGFFEGTGTAPMIRGLKNTAGIQTLSMGTNGATMVNFDAFADAIRLLQTANAPGPYAIAMHPQIWASLSKIKELVNASIGTSTKPTLEWPEGVSAQLPMSIYGVPVYLSSQISTTDTQGTSNAASSIYVFQPDQVIVVRRQPSDVIAGYNLISQSTVAAGGGVLLAVDGASHFTSDQTAIRATLRCDMVVPNPAAVVRITGVLP